MLPVGPDAPAAEACHLAVHLLACKGCGFLAQFQWCECFALLLIEVLQHLQFDRKAVAVPTGHETHLTATQDLMLVDDVFQHLVEGMAHMQGSIGVGRPVMKGEVLALIVQAKL